MKSALVGAISIASASRLRLMCAMLLSGRASHCDTYTGRPDSDCIATGVMNWQAASVITTCTVAPDLINRRHSSAALKHAAPPVKPSRMCRPANSRIGAGSLIARNVAERPDGVVALRNRSTADAGQPPPLQSQFPTRRTPRAVR